MGIRTWAFLVNKQEHVDDILKLIQKHNIKVNTDDEDYEVGETIYINCVLRKVGTDDYYMEFISYGGGDISDTWIVNNKGNIPQIYSPFNKPKDWMDEAVFIHVEPEQFPFSVPQQALS